MKYHNLDLEAFDYRIEGDGEQFRVRVTDSPVGQQWHDQADRVVVPPGFREQLRPLETGMVGLVEMIALGKDLAALLFPPGARSFLTRSREKVGEGEALRIRLRLHTYALADMPWEYVYVAPAGTPPGQEGVDGFLALDRRVSLVRYEVMAQAPGTLDPLGEGVLRMVVLLASPDPSASHLAEVDLLEEQHRIAQALRGVPEVGAEFYPEGTVDALQRALSSEAHIFHFVGHGVFQGQRDAAVGSSGGQGYVILVDERRQIWPFAADRLARNLSGRGVRLAVLNACEGARRDPVNAWTGVAPALIRAGIPAVVGMQYTVSVADAAAFNTNFYRALAAGQSVDAAVTDGRLAILNRSRDYVRDWGIPVLYLRAEEGVLFPVRPVGPSTDSGRGDRDEHLRHGAPVDRGPAAGDEHLRRGAPVDRGQAQVGRRALRTALMEGFSLGELKVLCADVQDALAEDGISEQVNLEMVGGSGKMVKVINLIGYLDRRGYLGYLEEAVRRERPGLL
jgi:hypothetical protein